MGSNGHGMARHRSIHPASSQPPSPMHAQNKQHTHLLASPPSPPPHPWQPGGLSPFASSLPPSPTLPPASGTASAHAPRYFTKFPSLPVTSRQSWTLDASSPGTLVPSWPSNRHVTSNTSPGAKKLPLRALSPIKTSTNSLFFSSSPALPLLPSSTSLKSSTTPVLRSTPATTSTW
ncbi:hypothetical protein LX32DRAFT_638338 [Colletotrichum zoysiae]|uniref:Uncharacterized protein n=1 Tax=Colletotrichum zoysiae TaxID=1216348 RepID=A0AAD9HLN7_9PEZI|nr:hypothetical protein LX32DRAFT_638338 [Colletotrichum zoysiae]